MTEYGIILFTHAGCAASNQTLAAEAGILAATFITTPQSWQSGIDFDAAALRAAIRPLPHRSPVILLLAARPTSIPFAVHL